VGESGTPETFRRSHIKGGVEQMFMGQYQHSLDDKGRLTVPARYRDYLSDGAYITRGFDRNLMVWTASAFEKISYKVSSTNLADPDSRLLRRLIYSGGDRLEVDGAGRILIPQFLREFAKLELENNAMVVGSGDYFEIWSPNYWADQLLQLQDADTNMVRFKAFDISSS
jgi:MraZ protein